MLCDYRQLLLCVYRDLRLIDNQTSVIVATYSELFGYMFRGVSRLIFYGAPPKELMSVFSIWPLDVLVVALSEESNASEWIPEPIHSWALLESANQAMDLTAFHLLFSMHL